jgi:hypothetical protein
MNMRVKSQDSSVRLLTTLGTERPGIGASMSNKGGDFLYSKHEEGLWGPYSYLFGRYNGQNYCVAKPTTYIYLAVRLRINADAPPIKSPN